MSQAATAARALASVILLGAMLSSSCAGTFSRKYEYDEDIHLALDGSATVYLNASIPALVALRGFDLDPDPRARFDREAIRRLYETPVSHIESLTTSRRDNRRYLHLRLAVPDMRRLSEVAPFAWSRYQMAPDGDVIVYRQVVGPSAGHHVSNAGWSGEELVAFRLHLPSRVPFFNAPSREIERGNIIVWDQPLVERIQGRPVDIVVHMEPQSILARTLTLFLITVGLAALTFAAAIWWVVRRARGAPTPQLSASDRR